MSLIQKSLKLEPDLYYIQHLSIINAVLPIKLTHKEIEVLAHFMAVDSKLTEDDRFNSVVRKIVREKLKLSPGGLSNHLNSMIAKGFLRKTEMSKKITIREFLIPDDKFQGYQFKIVKNETNK